MELDKNGVGAVVLKSLFEEQIMLKADHKLKQAEKNDLIYSNFSETLDYIDDHVKAKELNNYIELIKEAVSIPVAVKISPYFANLGRVIHNLENNGADAIVMFNKFASPDIDINKQILTHADVFSQPSDIYNSLRAYPEISPGT